MPSFRRRSNYLSLSLLDALEDENLCFVENLLGIYSCNPNHIVPERDIAPIHYVVGIENVPFAEKATEIILRYGGDSNLQTSEGITPLHVASHWGRTNIVKMLLENNGDINILDEEGNSPVACALAARHFEIIQIIQEHVYKSKLEKKIGMSSEKNRDNLTSNIATSPIKNHLHPEPQATINIQSTNRINYNFDAASPFYVNITHRRNKNVLPGVSSERPNSPPLHDLFKLTEHNLQTFTDTTVQNSASRSAIDLWRDKVWNSKSQASVLKNLDNFYENLTKLENSITTSNSSLSHETFLTAPEQPCEKSLIMRSPDKTAYVVQLTEQYVHTDHENKIVFFEKKIPVSSNNSYRDKDIESDSAPEHLPHILITLDYDTDNLRKELTCFGDSPGPITKSTKKLYLKKLMKYKRNPPTSLPGNLNPSFSVELERTLKNADWMKNLQTSIGLERAMSEKFQNNACSKRNWREGHLKMSFVYLLIDPRRSKNLPNEQSFFTEQECWKIFLSSIFYVGKGKSSRPYAHLYDAMKYYTISVENGDAEVDSETRAIKNRQNDSKKLNRIVSIWENQQGVVCLHVFHGIMAVDAYTREASMIDCLGLQHLTNQKRGDYYGITGTWTMRERKMLGIGLLYKAMLVYLAEGESQLMPSDLN